ncbi:MAG: DUF4163 domain-containing protein [Chitinophagales bacterium]|nr:DUF4163 domain-containing protein [Chitinophagales bacterium]
MTKKILIYLLCACCVACQQETERPPQAVSPPPAPATTPSPVAPAATALPKHFYKHLVGIIAGQAVAMDLVQTDEQALAYLRTKDAPVLLAKTQTPEQWQLSDYAKGKAAGTISAVRFTDARTLAGKYSAAPNAAAQNFSLQESYTGSTPLLLNAQIQRQGNCNTEGSTCFDWKVIYPQLPDTARYAAQINPQIEQAVSRYLSNGQNTLAAAWEHQRQAFVKAKNPLWEVRLQPSVLYNQDGKLSIGFEHYEQKGTAHPLRTTHYLSFQLQTGKALALTDFMTATQYQKLAGKKLAAAYPQAAATLSSRPLKMSADFYVAPDGIVISYPSGTLLPPQAGDLQVKIPFKELQ